VESSIVSESPVGIGDAEVSPALATLPLKSLSLNFRLYSGGDEKVLRNLKLEKINDMTPEAFWKEIEKRCQADQELIARIAKLPKDSKELNELIWAECGQYPRFKVENGEVVEVEVNHSGKGVVALLAFPKLRKLSTGTGGDYSALVKLTELEEINASETHLRIYRSTLKQLPKLKMINGKPAKEFLDR
jgi:hypothetical protein